MEPMKPEDRKELVDEHGEDKVAEYERLQVKQASRNPDDKLSYEDRADDSKLESLAFLLFDDDFPATPLEKEFFEAADLINAKIAEAVKALAEVDRLALEHGIPTLVSGQYMEDLLNDDDDPDKIRAKLHHIDISELEGAIESLGWSTSSSYC